MSKIKIILVGLKILMEYSILISKFKQSKIYFCKIIRIV